MRRTRKDSITRAIDGMLADRDHGEDEGEVQVHDPECAQGRGKTCTCVPRILLVPPAAVGKVRSWLRKLDSAVRWT